MLKRKYKKSDKDVRSSLWIAYDRKDYYTDVLIQYREMEVDHIVPEWVFEDETRKRNVLSLLGLANDFEKDSLYNFIPTRRAPNSSKSNEIDKGRILAALSKAKSKLDKVMELIDRYNQEGDLVEYATKIAVMAIIDEDKQLAADIIFDEEIEFEAEENINKDQFLKSISRVKLHAVLPTLNNFYPGCSFSFRPIKMRECMICLEHKEIFEKLFVGKNIYDDLNNRPYMRYRTDKGDYQIQLGNCFFYLNEKETIELCQIVDRYVEVYFQRVHKIEEEYKIGNMLLKDNGEIKLCTLSKEFCHMIFNFINYPKKDWEWDLFEANDIMIKIYTQKHKSYGDGYHAIIVVREENEKFFWYSKGEVGLYLKPYYNELNAKISVKNWWTPEYVLNWMIDSLFPKCLEEYLQKKEMIDYKEESKHYFSLYKNEAIYSLDVCNINEVSENIRKVQSFFTCHNNRSINLKYGSKKIYESLHILVNNCKEEIELSYISSNLGEQFKDINDLIFYLNRIGTTTQNSLSYIHIDLVLRCFIECLERGNPIFTLEQGKNVWNNLSELIEEYNYYLLLERYK